MSAILVTPIFLHIGTILSSVSSAGCILDVLSLVHFFLPLRWGNGDDEDEDKEEEIERNIETFGNNYNRFKLIMLSSLLMV